MTTLKTSHAVSRSSELLSCARTALKIAQTSPSPEQQWLLSITGTQLHLHDADASPSHTDMQVLLEDGLTLLRQMKHSLMTLGSLVKRRGHTNDPTEEISRALRQFEEDAKELSSLQLMITQQLVVVSQQQKRHYDLVSAWLQAVASQQTQQLKEVIKTRGAVLQHQAQRRKMLNPTKASSAVSSKPQSSSSCFRPSSSISSSPLFTMTGNNAPVSNGNNNINSNNNHMARQLTPTNVGTTTCASAPSSYGYTGYGGGYSGAGGGGYSGGGGSSSNGYGAGGGIGYGGGYYYSADATATTGMRQRNKAGSNYTTTTNGNAQNTTTVDTTTMQLQIQERQERRQTQSRLESARQAEKTLVELGTLFGKMSTLVAQQGEVLEKVEDDVEAALGDVTAGQEEIQVLYTIKKGNRALILKVFGILIFFILFMRLY